MAIYEQKFLEEAIRLAIENVDSGKGGPFGAVVVKNGEIVGKGANSVTTTDDPTAHAEVNAIRDACKNLNKYQLDGCDIYSSCEPCPMCLGAIYWARPDNLYFAAGKDDASEVGFDDSFIYEEISKKIEDRNLPSRQIRLNSDKEPFKSWTEAEQKIEY